MSLLWGGAPTELALHRDKLYCTTVFLDQLSEYRNLSCLQHRQNKDRGLRCVRCKHELEDPYYMHRSGWYGGYTHLRDSYYICHPCHDELIIITDFTRLDILESNTTCGICGSEPDPSKLCPRCFHLYELIKDL